MTKQPARIQVKETERYWGDFEGSFESIISSLESKLDDGWEGIEDDYEQYSDYPSPFLYKHREETDKEYDKRMRVIEKQKAEKLKDKERRRKEYEKLKKEFEDTP